MWSWNEFVAGWISGVCSIIVGHPLETIKVRQQINPSFGPLSHITKVVKNEGVRGFYKGLLYPLWSSGITTSIFFGVYGNTLRFLEKSRGEAHHSRCCEGCPIYEGWHWHCFAAGCVGGLAATIVNTPVELVKTILQANDFGNSRNSLRLTPSKCLGILTRTKGIRGCFQGGFALLLRDVPAFGLYTVCYEHITCMLQRDKSTSNVSIYQEAIAGGCSGVITWTVVLPIDVAKSRIMSDSGNISGKKYHGLKDCFRKIYAERGYKGFFKGFWTTTIRAFPVNLVCFVSYEQVLRVCKRIQNQTETPDFNI